MTDLLVDPCDDCQGFLASEDDFLASEDDSESMISAITKRHVLSAESLKPDSQDANVNHEIIVVDSDCRHLMIGTMG